MRGPTCATAEEARDACARMFEEPDPTTQPHTDVPNLFCARLKTIREQLGISQEEFAHKTGFHPSTISLFETGKRKPGLDNLIRLVDTLGVSADYILGRTDKPERTQPDAIKQIVRKELHAHMQTARAHIAKALEHPSNVHKTKAQIWHFIVDAIDLLVIT